MNPDIAFDRVSALTDVERAEIHALAQAVYPPESDADWPGRKLEWSPPEWCVRLREPGGGLQSCVGVLLRDGEREGRSVRIGGVGGVMTHPAARRRGLAGLGMQRAVEFFQAEVEIAFGLLVCEPSLLAYYGRLGWQEYKGRLIVRQRGEQADFTFNRVMVYGVRSPAPRRGVIDLMGPPW